MAETSTKPYLIRAIHEWCTDNGYRPYIAVAVDEHTIVPREFVRNGEIVLNVSADASNRLRLGNDLIEFEARFNRVARQVSIPVENVTAVYAAETGQGMAFEVAPRPVAASEAEPQQPSAEAAAQPAGDVPVPASDAPTPMPEPPAPAPVRGPVLVDTPEPAPSGDASPPPAEPSPPRGRSGRPKLTRVK